MADEPGPLGEIALAATTLYVADLDAALHWYADVLGLIPAMVGTDGHRYATFRLGGGLVVLEPIEAALEPHPPGAESSTINLIVARPATDVHAELVAKGVACGEIVDSPHYSSFLFRDLDGNRFYAAQPVVPQ
ncbi:MAG TPA: VOC family protein [Mycobacteriales bacterium]|jgi:catechol 2,3-dioxygenase-like lactoylglutathione lyase family enzyme|nr:VOC family protein [Mycobacteriales bacterium]